MVKFTEKDFATPEQYEQLQKIKEEFLQVAKRLNEGLISIKEAYMLLPVVDTDKFPHFERVWTNSDKDKKYLDFVNSIQDR